MTKQKTTPQYQEVVNSPIRFRCFTYKNDMKKHALIEQNVSHHFPPLVLSRSGEQGLDRRQSQLFSTPSGYYSVTAHRNFTTIITKFKINYLETRVTMLKEQR